MSMIATDRIMVPGASSEASRKPKLAASGTEKGYAIIHSQQYLKMIADERRREPSAYNAPLNKSL